MSTFRATSAEAAASRADRRTHHRSLSHPSSKSSHQGQSLRATVEEHQVSADYRTCPATFSAFIANLVGLTVAIGAQRSLEPDELAFRPGVAADVGLSGVRGLAEIQSSSTTA